ncbi:MAG: DNA topoisomerase [Candidatus Thorarchaeota archaeon]
MVATVSIFAEKPSIARALVRGFSIVYKLKFKGAKGKTKYNYVYKTPISTQQIIFKIGSDEYRLSEDDQLIITSVTGHVLQYEYPPPYDKESNWHNSDPLDLVELEPIEIPIRESMVIHVQEIGRYSDVIIIATDWDGHGESIGRQVVDIVTGINKRIKHGRMQFTSTGPMALKRAFETQGTLDWDWIKQVDSLRKQDLRMGSSLTRFLTVGVQNQGIHNTLVSYGPCQTSVLWLITHRYLENKEFNPQTFWRLALKLQLTDEDSLFLDWKGNPSYDEEEIDSLLSELRHTQQCLVTDYNEEIAFIKRPIPLDTDALESQCAQFLKISPKRVADIAERLYNNGFITYPRTESSYYLQKDLTPLTNKFVGHPEFGNAAQEAIAIGGTTNPSKGRFTKDHEPIRPAKAATRPEIAKSFSKTPSMINHAWAIYVYVVWRFLATVHIDAKVTNQYLVITAASEEFIAKGQKLLEPGFLKFYKYKTISIQELPPLKKGTSFLFETYKHHGFTTPPQLWSEAHLITKMAALNLGTDATRSSHIDTVQKRQYTVVQGPQRNLVPTSLGLALYQVLTQNAGELILPEIRGRVETWTQHIRTHEKTPEDVDKLVMDVTTRGMQQLKANQEEIFSTLARSIESMTGIGKHLGICPECQGSLVLHQGKAGSRFLRCSNPLCETSLPLPKKGNLETITDELCRICNGIPLLVSTRYHKWILCPYCWSTKGTEDKPWFCSECDRTDCPISGSWEFTPPEQYLGDCPHCGHEVHVRIEQDSSPVTQVMCSNCKHTWKAPHPRKGTNVSVGAPCTRCGRQTLSIFKRGKKPYRLCVFCSIFFFETDN